MNYEALKLLVNSLVANFKCTNCTGSVTEKDINLLAIEGQKIVLDIKCPNCDKKTLIKSEVVSVDLTKMNLSQEQISMLKNKIEITNAAKIMTSQTNINDKIIVDLNRDLKKENLNVSDLFDA
ncbi:MAG: hypothetical protein PHI37_04235 [Candidatus Gracilibacteria bacterium]|nr:hypothetical protein [Candidatus Gracilibacteria bacterium]